jgi:hypothetical protein
MHPLYLDKKTLLLANRLAQKNGWRHVDERELTTLSPKLKFPSCWPFATATSCGLSSA